MQELIQKMLRVEEEARTQVSSAEIEARSMVQAAQRAGQQEGERKLEAAREEARHLLEQGLAAANQDKIRLLAERRAEVVAGVRASDADVRKAAESALRAVLG